LIAQTGRELSCKYYNTSLPRLIARIKMMMCIVIFHDAVKVKRIFELSKELLEIKQKRLFSS